MEETSGSNRFRRAVLRRSIRIQNQGSPTYAFTNTTDDPICVEADSDSSDAPVVQSRRRRTQVQQQTDSTMQGSESEPQMSEVGRNNVNTDDENNNKKKNSSSSGPMAATPAEVTEYPKSYVFTVDMPGLKFSDIKVQVEGESLVISGERKRKKEKEGVKYFRMEMWIGKFIRKFALPENANVDKISAICQDGVVTVTVEKLPPLEPKLIPVQVA